MAVLTENIDLAALHKAASEACCLLKVLANTDRLLLLCQLSQNEYCVRELEDLTGIKQPTLSQQLTVLRNVEMVSTRREGKQIFYSIASQEALAIMKVLYELYCKQGKGRNGGENDY